MLTIKNIVVLITAISITTPTAAQDPEFFENPAAELSWTIGRRFDESQLRYCIDRRDPDWEISREIATAIASALLLEPIEYITESETVSEDITKIYAIMIAHCDLFMGFKLIPDAYQSWLTITRPYYTSEYLYVSNNTQIKKLNDLPRNEAIGAKMGTLAFIRLMSLTLAIPQDKRWPIFPIGTNILALQMLRDNRVGAALVWGPAFWSHQRVDPSFSDLKIIDPDPLPQSKIGVGGLLLANQTFLRTAIDEAIEALIADGTIGNIIEAFEFPAQAL